MRLSGGQNLFVSPNGKSYFGLTAFLSIKKGYRYTVRPYLFCKVLINLEVLKTAHDKSTCTEVLLDARADIL